MASQVQIFDDQFYRQFHLVLETDNNNISLYYSQKSDLSIIQYIDTILKSPYKLSRLPENELEQKLYSEKTNDNSNEESNQGKIVDLINNIIRTSLKKRASDIHFETKENGMDVRMRIDGILHVELNVNKEEIAEILSRIKIMASLDIAEKRRPQDGRIRFSFENRTIDIRVSTIPTEFGEKAVLRLLDKAQLKLNLDELGFDEKQLILFKKIISYPNGIILVTGPTGSGKTTTLYAALNYLQSPKINISTVEDPIEYNLEGINQTQIKPEIKVTFASMLRSLLRQDPNILMVGEIRDPETLQIAIQASLTGHLVFSTIHTNSSIATISRLIDMDCKSLLLASTLKIVVAQRLLRKNCPRCFQNTFDENNSLIAQQLNMTNSNKSGQSSGCEKCNFTGYYGRTAIYEILEINDELKDAITNEEDENTLLKIAKSNGFKTMPEHAIELIKEGITTPVEVIRELQM